MKKSSILIIVLLGFFTGVSSQQNSSPPQPEHTTIPDSVVYIVDGKPVEKDQLNSIDPKDVVQVTVLKDKNSTALYGKKAKNGAILITTRQEAIRIYHLQLSSISAEYAGKIKDIQNESDMLYVIDDKPLKEGYESTLMNLNQEQIKEIKLIDSELTLKTYGIESNGGAVLIKTK